MNKRTSPPRPDTTPLRGRPARLRRCLRYGTAILLIAGSAAALGSSGPSRAAPAARQQTETAATPSTARGTPLWVEPLRTLSESGTRKYLKHAEFSAAGVRHGVRLLRVVYRTVDPHGRPTTASGLLALPVGPTGTLTTVSFAHGTTSYRGDAPSSLPEDGFTSAPAVAYASAGYAAVAPDYLGLGVGPGPQPWFDAPSESAASLDLLRAARAYTAGLATRTGSDVLATGFSQGASAALALARSLQDGADPSFRVRAVAPVSGAYAFRSTELPALLNGSIPPQVAVPYVSYLLTSYDRVYGVYRSPAELFRQPYADRVETLFNSEVPGQDMMRALPSSLQKLLTAKGFQQLQHPTGGLARGLRTADAVCAARLSTSVRLDYAKNDEQAVNANTAACMTSLRQHGTAVRTDELGTPDYAGSRHLGSAVAGVTDTLHWFHQVAPPRD